MTRSPAARTSRSRGMMSASTARNSWPGSQNLTGKARAPQQGRLQGGEHALGIQAVELSQVLLAAGDRDESGREADAQQPRPRLLELGHHLGDSRSESAGNAVLLQRHDERGVGAGRDD